MFPQHRLCPCQSGTAKHHQDSRPPQRMVPKWETPSRPLDPRASRTDQGQWVPLCRCPTLTSLLNPMQRRKGSLTPHHDLHPLYMVFRNHFPADLLLPWAKKPEPCLLAALQNVNIPNLTIVDQTVVLLICASRLLTFGNYYSKQQR